MLKKLALLGAIGAMALATAGCDDDAAAPAAAISGTAAVGAPIPLATVTLRCNGATTDITTTTNATGGYSVTAAQMTSATATVPCAIRVSGTVAGNPVTLFSLAAALGVANITPLTNLVVERAASAGTGGNATTWFNAGTGSINLTAVNGALAAAETAIGTALQGAAGQAIPFDVFTTRFAANGVSPYDVWLDELDAALTTAGTNYSALVTAFVSNGTFPTITIDLNTGGGGGGGGTGTMTMKTYVNGILAATVNQNGVDIPTNLSAFCAAGVYYNSAAYAAAGVTNLTCSFAGNKGTVSGRIQPQGSPISVAWRTEFTWTAAAAAVAAI